MALPALADQRLTLVDCCVCHVEFAIPTAWDASLRQSHATFYCPAGHAQSYRGETEAERLRKETELLRRRLAFAQNAEDAAEKREERQRRRTAAAKGVATKLRRSIAAGQCPCCRKRFADLQEHMEQRHPAFDEAAEGT